MEGDEGVAGVAGVAGDAGVAPDGEACIPPIPPLPLCAMADGTANAMSAANATAAAPDAIMLSNLMNFSQVGLTRLPRPRETQRHETVRPPLLLHGAPEQNVAAPAMSQSSNRLFSGDFPGLPGYGRAGSLGGKSHFRGRGRNGARFVANPRRPGDSDFP